MPALSRLPNSYRTGYVGGREQEDMMPNGWMGKILWVDLGQERIWVEKPEQDFYARFLGTYGIGARLLYSRMSPDADPLGPRNILGLTTGPVARTPLPCSSRFVAVAKSPLTGTWGDANSGGGFGMALKGAGFDAVFLTGVSRKPVYLWIHDGAAELRSAEEIWGLDTAETDDFLKEACPAPGVQVACIGPASEALSRISGIVTDKGRIAARMGLGAVMGSKKLKAIVAGGREKPSLYDRDQVRTIRHDLVDVIRDPENLRMVNMRTYGTAGGMIGAILTNHAPIKNWKGVGERDYPNSENLDGDKIIADKMGPYRCGGCAVGCGGILHIDLDGAEVETHRPEYETLSAFGPLLLVDDLDAILEANHLCNMAGLDTMSAGTAIAFAMECYEKGIITAADTGGVELAWGNAKGMLTILREMIHRKGFGDVLADGAAWAAERIGGEATLYAMTVGAEGLPMCDPRGTPGWATTYTTDATPAHHMQGGSALPEFGMGPEDYIAIPEHEEVDKHDYEAKGPLAAEAAKMMHAVNCSGICAFAPMSFEELIEVVNAITGHGYDYEEILDVGERVAILRQAFNVREGFAPDDFRLPERVRGNPPLEAGPTAGVTIDLELQNRAFYEAMGWDAETGVPDGERVLALGNLEDIYRDFHD
jgi:aldehyde:ferredoxin oxidoreductase